MKTSFILMALAIAVFLSPKAFSQWQPEGMIICDAMEDQNSTRTISDGNGGAFILWHDSRSPYLYAQHLNSYGIPQWGQNGMSLCNYAQSPIFDAFEFGGGFLLSWTGGQTDSTSLFFQGYDANGTEFWQTNGVPIVTGGWGRNYPRICTDGEFVFASWADWRLGKLDDVWLQKFNSSGGEEWVHNGICVRTAPYSQNYARPICDGSGGAYVVWVNDDSSYYGQYSATNIYVQHVSSSGVLQWPAEGKVICDAPKKQVDYDVIQSGNYGYIVWEDYRSGKAQVYAQKWDQNGTMLWGNNGTLVSAYGSIKFGGKLLSDGQGGIIIVYADWTKGNTNVTAIRLDPNGNVVWKQMACALDGMARSPFSAVSNGNGGIAVAWTDRRNDNGDVYANIIDKDGNYVWNPNGVVLVKRSGTQENITICYNGSDAIIGAWDEVRYSVSMMDIFAGKCKSWGAVPVELNLFEGQQVGRDVNLKWQTTSETNNAGFFVERNAGNGWVALSFINGNGTTARVNNYEYIDNNAVGQKVAEIKYRLKQVDFDGTENYSEVISVKIVVKSADNFLQNYPNPFSARTTLEFFVAENVPASLAIYNMLGQKVWEVMIQQSGWQKKDFINQNLPRGNYWLRLVGQKAIQKMITIY